MTQKRGATGSVTPRFSGSIYVNDCCLASRAISAFYVFSVRQRSCECQRAERHFSASLSKLHKANSSAISAGIARSRSLVVKRQICNIDTVAPGYRYGVDRSVDHRFIRVWRRGSALRPVTPAPRIFAAKTICFLALIVGFELGRAARRSSHPCSARCPESRLIPHGAPRRSNPRIQV